MSKKHWMPLLPALILSFSIMGAAQARSGKAAYHLHTNEMVTAARHEPVGSVLKVRNPQNGRTVTVRVNDRGPWNGNRILDLSTGAFRALYGGLGRGVGPVDYVVVSRGGGPRWVKRSYKRRGRKRAGSKYRHRRSHHRRHR